VIMFNNYIRLRSIGMARLLVIKILCKGIRWPHDAYFSQPDVIRAYL